MPESAAHLDAVIDHVAIAVPSWDGGERRWREELGGGVVAFGKTPAFWSRQLRYANGAKLELLAPPPESGPDNFVRRYLDRFGAGIHHVTLKVPGLLDAVEVLKAAGLAPVDVRVDNPYWHEAFLRPSEAGGLVVQVAWSAQDDEQWARHVGHVPETPRADAPALIGPLLGHPDLAHAEWLWRALGARVATGDGALTASWPGSPLTVRIQQADQAGPMALLIGNGAALPADPETGPELRVAAR